MTNEATTTIQTLTQRSTTMPGHVMKIRRSTLVVAVMLGILLPRVLFAQTYTASPAPFLLVQDNAGSIINAGCVWTYQAGTTTPATTYSTSTGTPNTNPIIADSAGRFTAFLPTGASFKFTYENIPCSSIAHGSVLRTVDGIAATPASSVGVDVTGTAGEAITAGQAVYLSDGSGAKNAGQWYKADSTNTYSATTNWVGIATATISAAASGSIRIAGTVSGLSSLAVGSKYYIGAAGALTATAPTNKRELGEADTATTLVLTGNPRPPANTAGSIGQVLTSTGATTDPSYQAIGFVDDFRLSLTTALPVTTADVTAATTLFWTPLTGNRITLFNSAGLPETCSLAELSIAVPNTASTMYDVWVLDSTFGTCTGALEVLAWTNDTTRATAIARSSGRWTKSGDLTRLYVGSFRTTTVSGQTEDSAVKRFVWNAYNQKPRLMVRQETTGTWNYSTKTWRQANGNTANQLAFVIGVNENAVDVSVGVMASMTGNSAAAAVALGLDSTTTPTLFGTGGAIAGNTAAAGAQLLPLNLHASVFAGIGFHFVAWLEITDAAAGTTSWYALGNSFDTGLTANAGLVGTVWG